MAYDLWDVQRTFSQAESHGSRSYRALWLQSSTAEKASALTTLALDYAQTSEGVFHALL